MRAKKLKRPLKGRECCVAKCNYGFQERRYSE